MRLLPAEYLPDDYEGPNAGTENEIIGDDDDAVFGYHMTFVNLFYAYIRAHHSPLSTFSASLSISIAERPRYSY